MARISRVVAVGHPHHITQRGVRSMDIFHTREDRLGYLRFLKEETDRFGVEVLAWCLMTNHVHFVGIPQHEDSLAKGFGQAHKRYTRMKNFAEGVRGYLFQGRFSSCVLDERHLLAAVRYVELNPVRAGLADMAWDYPWSSAAFHVGNADVDLLVSDRTLLGLITDWRLFLAGDADSDAPTAAMVKATRTGRPAGDDHFLETIGRATGRILTRKKPGRSGKAKGKVAGQQHK